VFLGIDLGTSSLKALLVDSRGKIVAQVSRPLEVARPSALWSEQDPEIWWQATLEAVDALKQEVPRELAAVDGIGLSGQMHGATVLGADHKPLRPCILWNDGRAFAECEELERKVPTLRDIAGNIAMPGFTAPKILWLQKHEPEIHRRIAVVLLPKAYLRLKLGGELAEDMSDASGTLWLDVGRRDWSDLLLDATGLSRSHMPRLVEGTDVSCRLRGELTARWGMSKPPVIAGGAGDNAASAIGLGAISAGDAFVSIGTSGVVFATTDKFRPWPAGAVHAFCHALPNTWHQMGVMLSAASALDWWARATGAGLETLLREAETHREEVGEAMPLFLPYLSGERTPHNDANARGGFIGLSHAAGRAELTRAVIEGVACGFRDCLEALRASGTMIEHALVTGGGTRSPYVMDVLATVLGIRLVLPEHGEYGAAYGAARLGRLAASGENPSIICQPPPIARIVEPDVRQASSIAERYARYRRLYPALKECTA
jgi:xylulokinase